MKKVSEEIHSPVGTPVSQRLKTTNAKAILRSLAGRKPESLKPHEKALQKSAQIQQKMFGGTPAMKPTYAENKVEDRIYTMAFVKECKNLSKEDKLRVLEFIYKEPDMKKVLGVVEKYVELDEGIWTRVIEATKQAKSLFYTKPAGKKDLKFAGHKPKSLNRQLSKIMAREGKIEWPKIKKVGE